jgi:hypothetical protein
MAVIKETAEVPMAIWKEKQKMILMFLSNAPIPVRIPSLSGPPPGAPLFMNWKEWAKAFTKHQRIHFLAGFFSMGSEQQMILWAFAHECPRQY